MGNFKYTLQANRNKIVAGVGIVVIIVAGFGLYKLFTNPKLEQVEEEYADQGIKKADYIFLADDKGKIELYGTKEDKIVNDLSLDGSEFIYSRDNDLETIMAYSNGTFYELNEENGVISKKEVIKYDGNEKIKSFKFSDEFIVALSDEKTIIINLADKKINTLSIKDIDNYVVADNTLVYSIGDYIYSQDLTKAEKLEREEELEKEGKLKKEEKEEPIKIEIGDKSDALFFMNDKVIDFNNFGDGKDKSTLLKINPKDLYIEFANKHDNKNVYPITPDSDDDEIKFIDGSIRDTKTINSHYKTVLDENEKDSKERVALPDSDSEVLYNPENTVSTKGYFYTNKDKNLTIFDLRAEGIDKVVNTDATFFMPILK